MKKYQYKVQGVDYEVEIVEVEGKIARVNVNGIPLKLRRRSLLTLLSTPYWQLQRRLLHLSLLL